MILVQNLRKRYGSSLILRIESLDFEPGVHILHGRNGAGKSTFLKILAGYIPFKGSIVLDGNIHLQKHHVKHRLAINFSEAEPVFPHYLVGWDLIEMVKTLKKGTDEQVKEFTKAFDMGGYLKQPTGSYSSGMLKKLALLLAFLGEPRLILLDEPFTTIDKESQGILNTMISSRAEAGINFMISSHHKFKPEMAIPVQNWLVENTTIVRTDSFSSTDSNTGPIHETTE